MKNLKNKLCYGVGAIGLDLSYGLFYSYLAKYLTDILRLNKKFLLFLTPIARIWDGINDPMMGILADSRSRKNGKMKSFIIYSAVPLAILTILMYFCPELNKNGLMIYAAVIYILWGMINTMADVPMWSLPNVMTPGAEERGQVISFAKILNGIGTAVPEVLFLVAGLVLPLVLTNTDNPIEYNKSKYLIISVVVSVLGMILFANSYFHVKERVRVPQKTRKEGEPSTLSRIFKCKPLMLVVAMGVLSSGRYMVQAAAVHVARYAFYIGPDLTGMTPAERTAAIDASVSSVKTIFQICAIVGMFGAMLFMPMLMKKFDYKKIM